jgi:hypothetical protein
MGLCPNIGQERFRFGERRHFDLLACWRIRNASARRKEKNRAPRIAILFDGLSTRRAETPRQVIHRLRSPHEPVRFSVMAGTRPGHEET